MCQTEPLDRIDEDRLMEIRHLLPVEETEIHPLNLMTGERFPSEADVYIKKQARTASASLTGRIRRRRSRRSIWERWGWSRRGGMLPATSIAGRTGRG